ncbi:GNAT family N-acetyltransferase [Yoonia sp. 208BN28-4]|uniref:GNAT family N-acetyltransferase n=1 Tax=Yoonia sp. 208BN28-4 TaxID=3126505 RepID=UPI0030AD578F
MADYSFRPITMDDLPMFKRWLDQPHIGGWWGDSGTEARLVQDDMDKDVVDMRIVSTDGTPFAYIQDYNAHAFEAPQYVGQPADARAIDTFLGDPAFLGQGHASGYMAARIAELRQSYPCVLTDPDPANTRAVAAYTRAGFRPLDIVPCEDGDPVQVMIAQ